MPPMILIFQIGEYMTKYKLKDKSATSVMVNHRIYDVAKDGTVELPDAENIDKNLFEIDETKTEETTSDDVEKEKTETVKTK